MMPSSRKCLSLVFGFFMLLVPIARSQGTVYLVVGSDTGIWEGMNTGSYRCTYNLSLFTDPLRNTARVMDPAFRTPLVDSYGTPMKLTWWMMAGNIFRYAKNTNVARPNVMTLELMDRYYGSAIRQWGDELTLHYHTFVWTDYNGDGRWYWNQAKGYDETAADFDETLAEMLIERETFPVSFRSGWHYMDNAWQQRLDRIIPYTLHNDWPAVRTTTKEPIDNVFDWSRAPSTWIPFHPSVEDYQLPGNGRGWNVRSKYMFAADSAFMARVFSEAAKGIDQVVCLWAHLPEADFPDNLRKVDASAHKAASAFPAVRFRYSTAVEAMRSWRGIADTTGPGLTVTEVDGSSTVRWIIQTDEPIFQTVPVVAVKDRYEQYRLVSCTSRGSNEWETVESVDRNDLAVMGVAVTDTAGNLSTTIRRYLPADVFVDDAEGGFTERSAGWTTSASAAWGLTSRVRTLDSGEAAAVRWTPGLQSAAQYNIFVQVPAVASPANDIHFYWMEGESVVDSIAFPGGLAPKSWVYVATRFLDPARIPSLEMVTRRGTGGPTAVADVVKFSPLVRDRWLEFPESVILSDVIVDETAVVTIPIRNLGIQPVIITELGSAGGLLTSGNMLPLVIPPMDSIAALLSLTPGATGVMNDTILIASNDPVHASVRIPFTANAREYYVVADDADSSRYRETGTWNFSVAQAYGVSSRYATPSPSVAAEFSFRLKKGGVYNIDAIVPETVNASLRARYTVRIGGIAADSVFKDQNQGSGGWVTLATRALPAETLIAVRVTDAMSPVVAGKVLRADAVRLQWLSSEAVGVEEEPMSLPEEFALGQNFPNPFNPTTMIRYTLPRELHVTLRLYTVLGLPVADLVDARQGAGTYTVQIDGSRLASGVYFCRMQAGEYTAIRRLVLIR